MNIYRMYRNRLIEISGKSRSLYSKTVSKKQAYNLGRIFESDSGEAEKFIDFLFGDTSSRYTLFTPAQKASFFNGRAIPDSNQKKAVEQEQNALKGLWREIDEIEKETGRYELFVGYPFVEGDIGNGVRVKAPLLLFPAKIIDEKGISLEIMRGEPVLFNKVFLLAYARENKLELGDLDMEFPSIQKSFGSIQAVRDYLAASGVKLKLTKQRQLVQDIEKAKEYDGEPSIRNFAVLGRFPLANSIYNDYIQMEKERLSSPALDALIKNRELKSKQSKNFGSFTVAQLDYSQECAVENIEKHSNIVIYGPPGTGKSQTLTNIISDAICKNKRVLVVSQKRTAIDVIYNRLGLLASKAMILHDPEKSKNEFYEKVRSRVTEAEAYKNTFNPTTLADAERNLAVELADLETLSSALFTPLPFGLTLQQMYVKSVRIDTDSRDYDIYKAMQGTPLMNLNYHEFSEAVKSITQMNKARLYYSHHLLSRSNPLIDYLRPDLNIDEINRVKIYINKLLADETLPFNVTEYPYSRYLLVYNLESESAHIADKKDSNHASVKPLADMISKIENPKLASRCRVFGAFPPFWPFYVIAKHKYCKRRKVIAGKLQVAQDAARRYISEFDLLKTVLEPDGFAMVIDNITYGSAKFLNKLLAALDEYSLLKGIITVLKTLSPAERLILDFAFNFATAGSDLKSKAKDAKERKNIKDDGEKEIASLTLKLLPIRIYHEVVLEEKKKEALLSKALVFGDIRNRIRALKAEKRRACRALALDKFNDDFKKRMADRPEDAKNFLHQIGKQDKLWSIRKLMQHFSEFLFDLFPCFMLSPDAVSVMMPLKADLFDLVLFDEASQIFIENTIPAIYRGRCLAVSGDSKQLRPTSVFVKRYMGDDTYVTELSLSDQAALEVESLLDLASSRLKPSHLNYHYRSKYEELINFSNYAFYGGMLEIAPNIAPSKVFRPIERIKVDGRWTDRKNIVEAKAVVDLVAKILSTRKNDETVGIVTFNSEQEECINETLDLRCQKDESFRKLYLKELHRREDGEYRGIFVKNLENVQGDERDIIIFSIGYAKNEEGRVNAQFGTLSMAGGENRLNVAITRAKEKIYVVTSVEPEEFTSIEGSKNLGPKLFKKYLIYARAVSDNNTSDAKAVLESLSPLKTSKPAEVIETTGEIDISVDMEKALKEDLEKLGYIVELNVGSAAYKISLAIFDPKLGRYVLGLECDYTARNASEAVLERDFYRAAFLESRGWKIMRVWSRDFWFNRAALITSIQKAIQGEVYRLNNEKTSDKPVKKSVPAKLVTKNAPAKKTETKTVGKKKNA